MNGPDDDLAGVDGGFVQYAGNLYFNAFSAATGGTNVLFRMAPDGTVATVDDGAGHISTKAPVTALISRSSTAASISARPRLRMAISSSS